MMTTQATPVQRRYSLIDAIRGAAVINMVLYHLIFDISYLSGTWDDSSLPLWMVIWERLIASSFIVVSGVAVNFSRRGFQRGLIVALCAVGVTVVTAIFTPELTVWFGVLHLLACAMLMTCALKRPLSRVMPAVGMAVSFLLFTLTYGIPSGTIGIFSFGLIRLPEALYQYKWLSVLGFLSRDFISGDYFPILPWIFLFLFGFFLWRLIADKGLDRFFTHRIPVLDFIGRHSLIIYLVHQPLLYGVCLLFLSRGAV